jgi:hypothetical protein
MSSSLNLGWADLGQFHDPLINASALQLSDPVFGDHEIHSPRVVATPAPSLKWGTILETVSF